MTSKIFGHQIFYFLCGLQRVIPEITMSSFESLSLDQLWAIITKDSFLSIRKLVATIFTISASNASCERVFSLSKVQWSEERNRLDVTTICSILKVIQNFNLSCQEMHSKLLKNQAVLKRIGSNEKYY